jgi:hypothetical protein
METAGYLASILIGITLGLMGGGGSILTVPVLVYLFGIEAVVATTYSLFIVGVASVVGSFSYFNKGLVNIRTAILFGIPSISAVFISRMFIVPAIPQVIINAENFTITKNNLLLVVFAVLMILASYSMIKKQVITAADTHEKTLNYPLIFTVGAMEGFLTGLVGAGGGFLIIPALVLLGKLPMKEAVGTSLVIIAVKSLIGFTGGSSELNIDWPFLLKVSAFALAGIFIGIALSKKVNGAKLKPAFGWFVLVMGVYVLLRETHFK